MNDPDGVSQRKHHSLSDWLALHELDPATCRRILDAMERDAAGKPAAPKRLNSVYQELDLEAAWLRTLEAMRDFLSEHQSIIDDTFEKTAKIVLDRPNKSRKALTLDNGPTEYPTIFYSYRGEPADCLIIAHEFGHALQIRASRGKFVPPIIREICAFLGEGALLSHALDCGEAQYKHLVQAWREDDRKYCGPQRDRLYAALLQPDAPYRYSWNYPIARYLALQISEQCSREWIWSVYQGKSSVQDVLRETGFFPS